MYVKLLIVNSIIQVTYFDQLAMPLVASTAEVLPLHDVIDGYDSLVAEVRHETWQIRDLPATLHAVVLHEQLLVLVPLPDIC
jgi:hypothetical protein